MISYVQGFGSVEPPNGPAATKNRDSLSVTQSGLRCQCGCSTVAELRKAASFAYATVVLRTKPPIPALSRWMKCYETAVWFLLPLLTHGLFLEACQILWGLRKFNDSVFDLALSNGSRRELYLHCFSYGLLASRSVGWSVTRLVWSVGSLLSWLLAGCFLAVSWPARWLNVFLPVGLGGRVLTSPGPGRPPAIML